MWLKNNIKEILSSIFGVAFIVFTAMKMVPIEAFIGVAVAVVMYYFEEKSKDALKGKIAALEAKASRKKD